MALKSLMLRKKIDSKKKELEALRERDAEFAAREAELEKSIEEAETDEERGIVEGAITEYEAEKAEHDEAAANLENEVSELESELNEAESSEEDEPETNERMDVTMEVRDVLKNEMEQRDIFARDDVKGWIGEIRSHISEKRDLTNIGLTIPEVFLGMLRENITRYSKLYRHVNVQRLSGTGREVIMGSVPEAIWTECCAVLNELSLGFNDVEVDCFKVGGYFKVCNAILEDSDINLASTLIDAIGQAIGLALDKAILYGQNTSTNYKMPLGVLSRLAQTTKPSDYPATARTWVDLHSTNIVTIPASTDGLDLFKAIVKASGAIKSNYARNEKTWVMNEATYTKLLVAAMTINASGAIVSGQTTTMPIIGGTIEILDFIPDDVILGGYFELYLLAERAGQKFAQSEHAFFLQDQTAFKGTARYDGKPVIAEAFIAIGLNGETPDATDVTFASDTANTGA